MTTITVWVLMALGHDSAGIRPSVPPTPVLYFATSEDCYAARLPIYRESSVKTTCIQATIIK